MLPTEKDPSDVAERIERERASSVGAALPRTGDIWKVVPAGYALVEPNINDGRAWMLKPEIESSTGKRLALKVRPVPEGALGFTAPHVGHVDLTGTDDRRFAVRDFRIAPALLLGSEALLAQQRAVSIRGHSTRRDAPARECPWFTYGDLGQPQLVVRFPPEANDKPSKKPQPFNIRYVFLSAWAIGIAPSADELVAPREKADGSRLRIRDGQHVPYHKRADHDQTPDKNCPTSSDDALEQAHACLRHITGIRVPRLAAAPQRSTFTRGEIVKVRFGPGQQQVPCVVVSPPQVHGNPPHPLAVVRTIQRQQHHTQPPDNVNVVLLAGEHLDDESRIAEVELGGVEWTIAPALLRCIDNTSTEGVVERYDLPLSLNDTAFARVTRLLGVFYDANP